jgi:predicted RNA-binding Zn ribbon-like protein
MDESTRLAENLNTETGYLCLDFANTANWHARENPEESLNSYADLLTWAKGVGVLDEAVALQLQKEADRRGADASGVLGKVIELREAIYRIFSAVARGDPPAAVDLTLLNNGLRDATAHQLVVAGNDGFVWAWISAGEHELSQMLAPIARSAADLLTSDQLDRVRECADDRGCGYLFFDATRNRSRRWCSMDSCGNRAKARRHYHRQVSAGE